jgi:type II secretory pathway pseudopilin PulG
MSILGFRKRNGRRGSLMTVVYFSTGISALIAGVTVSTAVQGMRSERRAASQIQARYVAEAALQQAMYQIGRDNATFQDSLADAVQWTLGDDQLENFATSVASLGVEVDNAPSGVDRNYQILATAQVGEVEQTVSARVRKNPPSKVFDYEYFLNNWGWWWGDPITGNGNQRTNGRFDFRYSPTVNGDVYSAMGIYRNSVEWYPGEGFGVRGLAGNDPDTYLHPYGDRVEMPNLSEMARYETLAHDKNGTISYRDVNTGDTRTVNAVHNGSLYLEGTTANPIVIDGPVVVRDNLAIRGVVQGQGTIYAGRNAYVMDNLSYKNGPTSYLGGNALAGWEQKDAWVTENQNKDLVAIAARESVLFGNMGSSSNWGNTWSNSSYGVKFQGDERVGPDGIPGTADDNVNFDRDGDGTVDTNWYDLDGDGAQDGNYVWSDIAPGKKSDGNYQTTAYSPGDCSFYTNWPQKRDSKGKPSPGSYKTFSESVVDANTFEAIFYTNHCYAGYMSGNVRINGSFITKDEAVVFNGSLTMNYDWRVHSRYNDDPNKFIDLGLPIANRIGMLAFTDGEFPAQD